MPVVLVPFRETADGARGRQLARLQSVLRGASIRCLVVTQSVAGRFNRGLLCNAGLYSLAATGADGAVIVHDVDLIPDAGTLALYHQLDQLSVREFCCLHTNSRYGSEGHFGGVVAARMETFKSINGFPNAFRGWGGEDDELRRRVHAAGLVVRRPRCSHVDLEGIDIRQKLDQLRSSGAKVPWKWEIRKMYETRCLRDGYREAPVLAQIALDAQGVLLVTPKKLFFCGDESQGLLDLWLTMSAAERRDQVRDRLRRRLGKPPETEQDRMIAEALDNPARFLKNVDPATVQKALAMMQDLPAEALGESDDILAAMRDRAGDEAPPPATGGSKKPRKNKRRKKKKKKAAVEGTGSKEETSPAETSPPGADSAGEAPPPLPMA